MKMIRAIIQPHRLEVVRDALQKAEIHGLTSIQAQGFGRQKGHKEIYRGAEYTIAFRPKVAIEVVVDDDKLDDAIEAILEGAQSGKMGDGKIFVWNVEDAIRIRTGERGPAAL